MSPRVTSIVTPLLFCLFMCSVLAIGVGLPLVDRSQRSVARTANLKGVLADFVLVAQGVCNNLETPPHGMAPMRAPDTFEAGSCYVYHFRNSTERPVYEWLEERLRARGFVLVHAPSIDHDVVYSFLGGPIFRIEFRHGHHHANIASVPDSSIGADPQLRREWKTEDFVLLL